MATPSQPVQTKVVRRQAFNFDTFAKDSLAKNYTVPAPVSSVAQALAENGNNEAAIVALINKGREAQAADTAWQSTDGWTVAEKNMPSATAFSGMIIPPSGVLQTARVLATTLYGMTADMSKEEKKTRRQKAMEFIKSNSEIRDRLKEQAIASAADEADEDED